MAQGSNSWNLKEIRPISSAIIATRMTDKSPYNGLCWHSQVELSNWTPAKIENFAKRKYGMKILWIGSCWIYAALSEKPEFTGDGWRTSAPQ